MSFPLISTFSINFSLQQYPAESLKRRTGCKAYVDSRCDTQRTVLLQAFKVLINATVVALRVCEGNTEFVCGTQMSFAIIIGRIYETLYLYSTIMVSELLLKYGAIYRRLNYASS
jgi:hypothetical protein